MDCDAYQDATSDRLDYCPACHTDLRHCTCEMDLIACSVQDVAAALDGITATLAHLTTTDEALRLARILGDLELKMARVTSATLQRADALSGGAA